MSLYQRSLPPLPTTGLLMVASALSGCGPMFTTYPVNTVSESDTGANDFSSDTGASDDSKDPENNNDNEKPNEDDDPDNNDCTLFGFDTIMQQARQDNSIADRPLFVYQAREADVSPFTEFQILSFQASPYDGPTSPVDQSLNGNNYADCSLCVLIVEGCDDNYSCDRVFFADEGRLNISKMSTNGGPFHAQLSGAVLREVSIDPETYTSTPVQGGDTWCIDNLSIEAGVRVVN